MIDIYIIYKKDMFVIMYFEKLWILKKNLKCVNFRIKLSI